MENRGLSETEYYAILDSYKAVEPPLWSKCDPALWEAERDRCASMYRAGRAHMPMIAEMFNSWSKAWAHRARRYAVNVKQRDAAAVAAVLESVDTETARREFKLARAYQAEIDALIAAPWGSL